GHSESESQDLGREELGAASAGNAVSKASGRSERYPGPASLSKNYKACTHRFHTSHHRSGKAKKAQRRDSQGETAELAMPTFAPNFITAIDVGSAKTTVLVAEMSDNGLRYRGHGVSESRGLRKGIITELDKAAGSIQKAVEVAENVAGIPIEHAIIGIAGAHIRGMNSHGGITFGVRSREIGRDEIRQAVDKARTVPLPADREILHLLPQEFILDDQPGVQDPTGMSATQNLVTAVNRAGVHVDDTIFEALACADSVLRSDERELGVCLVDLGAGS